MVAGILLEKNVGKKLKNVLSLHQRKYENNPTLKLVQYQAYKISESTDKDNIPDESTFHTAKNRVVNQTYYWSDTWKKIYTF